MEDWRYELDGLSAQDRLRAVAVYETAADRLRAGPMSSTPRAELRRLATAEGLDADHPWIEAAGQELQLLRGRTVSARRPRTPARLTAEDG